MGGRGFKEDEPPNFMGSFYSDTKGMVEKVTQARSLLPSVQQLEVQCSVYYAQDKSCSVTSMKLIEL